MNTPRTEGLEFATLFASISTADSKLMTTDCFESDAATSEVLELVGRDPIIGATYAEMVLGLHIGDVSLRGAGYLLAKNDRQVSEKHQTKWQPLPKVQ